MGEKINFHWILEKNCRIFFLMREKERQYMPQTLVFLPVSLHYNFNLQDWLCTA